MSNVLNSETVKKYGNLLWFSAVLTDANLIPDKKSRIQFLQ